MTEPLFIAVDLGAGSGRVFLTGVAAGELRLEEIRRFRYPARETDGHLRWDLSLIWGEIKQGLKAASARAVEVGRSIQSLAVNSWGVDYGLVDETGRLIADPVCYRDERTKAVIDQVFARVPRAELFDRTGIQYLHFNTLFQLFAEQHERPIDSKLRMLLIPDLINLRLTGRAVTEYTNATTTQMLNVETGDWDRSLLARLEIPDSILPDIVRAGSSLGLVQSPVAEECDLAEVEVIAPATHDTGSAIAGIPLQTNWAYISSGTWSLVGIERDRPLVNTATERFNLTNEGGVFGTTRLLKNVMGLWILERCRAEWEAQNEIWTIEGLIAELSSADPQAGLIYPDDPRFFNPPSMLEAIRQQLAETGQQPSADPVTITKAVLDSLAFRYASVLRTIGSLAGIELAGVQVVGGGSQNRYLNQLTADASGLKVKAGPVEATVVGNVLVQAIAAGRFASLDDARRHVADHCARQTFAPRRSAWLAAAAGRYAEIEARYSN